MDREARPPEGLGTRGPQGRGPGRRSAVRIGVHVSPSVPASWRPQGVGVGEVGAASRTPHTHTPPGPLHFPHLPVRRLLAAFHLPAPNQPPPPLGFRTPCASSACHHLFLSTPSPPLLPADPSSAQLPRAGAHFFSGPLPPPSPCPPHPASSPVTATWLLPVNSPAPPQPPSPGSHLQPQGQEGVGPEVGAKCSAGWQEEEGGLQECEDQWGLLGDPPSSSWLP